MKKYNDINEKNGGLIAMDEKKINEKSNELNEVISADTPSHENENQSTSSDKKKTKKKKWLTLVVLILILLGILCLLKRCSHTEFIPIFPDNNSVSDGQLDFGDYDEIKAGLQSKVDESYMNIKMPLTIEVDKNTKEALLMVQNSEDNKSPITLEIILENDEESIYSSPLINPNQFIENDTITRELETGAYKATAMFTVYDKDSLKATNKFGMNITVNVK